MEKLLTINLCDAKKLYSNASVDFKKQLEETFGKNNLSTKITDRIKTFDDACKELCGEDEDVLFYKKLLSIGCDNHVLYYQELVIIVKALNEGWEPNWDNSNEYKYYPWFKMGCRDSGFGFSFSYYVSWTTNAICGSRLCFKSRELSEYAGRQFEAKYKKYLIK